MKIDQAGDTVWSNRLGTSGWDEIYDISKTSDDNFLMLAYLDDGIGFTLFKANFYGDTLWSRDLIDFDESIVREVSDNQYIVIGTLESSSDIYLIYMNQDGQSGWTKIVELDQVFEIVTMDQTSDENLLMAGEFVNEETWIDNPGIVITDKNGSLVNSFLFDYGIEELKSLHLLTTDEYVLVCVDTAYNLLAIHANTSGAVLESKTFEGDPGDVIKTADGGYMIGMVTYDEEEDEYITLMKTDAAWNEEWSQSFRKEGYYKEVVTLIQTEGGGYVVFANLYDEVNEIADIYIRTTDSLGEGCYYTPYEDEEICLATVDLETGKNLVIWEKTPGKGIASYNIYRESTTAGKYEVIADVPFDSVSVYLDETSNPRQRSYRYKLSAVDSCGVESGLSYFHKTILLTVNLGVGTFNLSWDDYEYEGGGFTFEKFLIYRGLSATNLELIDSIAASYNTYIDTDAPADTTVYHQIAGVLTDECFADAKLKASKGPYSHSMSNIEDNRLSVSNEQLAASEIRVIIFPNPGTGHFQLQLKNLEDQQAKIEIIDITGKLIMGIQDNINKSFHVIDLDLQGYPEGIYLLKLTSEKAQLTKRLIIQ